MHDYNKIMLSCINKAKEFAGFTSTNPLVGACILKDGKILSYGTHEYYGKAHAEINVLSSCKESTKGATLFVTLEPCSSYGKTPPCVDSIIEAGIKEVYIGVIDPNPLHSGRSIKILKDAGIKVHVGLESIASANLIEPFIKFQKYGLPYINAKIAMSLDGKIASNSKDSKWITSSHSRELVHRMRESSDGILTGIGTILLDDPLLNVRLPYTKRHPVRIVLDSKAKISIENRIIKSIKEYNLIIYVSPSANKDKIKILKDLGVDIEIVSSSDSGVGLNLKEILLSLSKKGIINIMIECGSTLLGSFNDLNLIDKYSIFVAPKIIGGKDAPSPVGGLGCNYIKDAKYLTLLNYKFIENDIFLSYKVKDYTEDLLKLTNSYKG